MYSATCSSNEMRCSTISVILSPPPLLQQPNGVTKCGQGSAKATDEERQCSRCVRIIPSVVAASAVILSAGFPEPAADKHVHVDIHTLVSFTNVIHTLPRQQ